MPRLESARAAMSKAAPVSSSTSFVHILLRVTNDCRAFSVSRAGGRISRRAVDATLRTSELDDLTERRPDVVCAPSYWPHVHGSLILSA